MDIIDILRRGGRRLALTAGLLVACTALAQLPPPTPEALAGADAYLAMDLANAWRDQLPRSFVTAEAVHFVFADGSTVQIPAPQERMLVSVAPYVRNTHPCVTHTMSSCQGELVGVPMRVRAVHADGTVLLDEVMATMANGFIDLWLPRDALIELSFEVDGYRASGLVTTTASSPTCITTLRLVAGG